MRTGPIRTPDQPLDRCADGPEHAPELALPALGEHGAIPDERPRRRRDQGLQPAGLDLARLAQAGERREPLVRDTPARNAWT
jgi:hypothetical protein